MGSSPQPTDLESWEREFLESVVSYLERNDRHESLALLKTRYRRFRKEIKSRYGKFKHVVRSYPDLFSTDEHEIIHLKPDAPARLASMLLRYQPTTSPDTNSQPTIVSETSSSSSSSRKLVMNNRPPSTNLPSVPPALNDVQNTAEAAATAIRDRLKQRLVEAEEKEKIQQQKWEEHQANSVHVKARKAISGPVDLSQLTEELMSESESAVEDEVMSDSPSGAASGGLRTVPASSTNGSELDSIPLSEQSIEIEEAPDGSSVTITTPSSSGTTSRRNSRPPLPKRSRSSLDWSASNMPSSSSRLSLDTHASQPPLTTSPPARQPHGRQLSGGLTHATQTSKSIPTQHHRRTKSPSPSEQSTTAPSASQQSGGLDDWERELISHITDYLIHVTPSEHIQVLIQKFAGKYRLGIRAKYRKFRTFLQSFHQIFDIDEQDNVFLNVTITGRKAPLSTHAISGSGSGTSPTTNTGHLGGTAASPTNNTGHASSQPNPPSSGSSKDMVNRQLAVALASKNWEVQLAALITQQLREMRGSGSVAALAAQFNQFRNHIKYSYGTFRVFLHNQPARFRVNGDVVTLLNPNAAFVPPSALVNASGTTSHHHSHHYERQSHHSAPHNSRLIPPRSKSVNSSSLKERVHHTPHASHPPAPPSSASTSISPRMSSSPRLASFSLPSSGSTTPASTSPRDNGPHFLDREEFAQNTTTPIAIPRGMRHRSSITSDSDHSDGEFLEQDTTTDDDDDSGPSRMMMSERDIAATDSDDDGIVDDGYTPDLTGTEASESSPHRDIVPVVIRSGSAPGSLGPLSSGSGPGVVVPPLDKQSRALPAGMSASPDERVPSPRSFSEPISRGTGSDVVADPSGDASSPPPAAPAYRPAFRQRVLPSALKAPKTSAAGSDDLKKPKNARFALPMKPVIPTFHAFPREDTRIKIKYIDNITTGHYAINDLLQYNRLAICCQGASRIGSKLSLVCITARDAILSRRSVYIFDVARSVELGKYLKILLEDDKILKVSHNSRLDAEALFQQQGIVLKSLADTKVLSRMLTELQMLAAAPRSLKKLSLVSLLSLYHFPQNPHKESITHALEANRAFWDQPLTKDMLEFAAHETAFLLDVHQRLGADIVQYLGHSLHGLSYRYAYTNVADVATMKLDPGKIGPVAWFRDLYGHGGSDITDAAEATK